MDQYPTAVIFDRASYRVWDSAGLYPDFRRKRENDSDNHAYYLTSGVNVMSGFEIQSLPDVIPEPDGAVARSDQYKQHRNQFNIEMLRMLRGLHDPVLRRGDDTQRFLPLTNYDLRIVNSPNPDGIGNLRVFLLLKVFTELILGETDRAEATEFICRKLSDACLLCESLLPRNLKAIRFHWHPDRNLERPFAGHWVTDEELALTKFPCLGEVRREHFLHTAQSKVDYTDFCNEVVQRFTQDEIYSVPQPWPASRPDLLPTCKVMSRSNESMVLSVRIQPTFRTPIEHSAIRNHLDKARTSNTATQTSEKMKQEEPQNATLATSFSVGRKARFHKLFKRFFDYQEFFYATVQIAGSSKSAVWDIMSTYTSEHMVSEDLNESVELTQQSGFSRERPARILCLNDSEKDVAQFNLENIDFLPWGGLCPEAQVAARPGGWAVGVPDLENFDPNDPQLHLPEIFIRRDLELDPALPEFAAC